jgi:hypothetical protein
MSNRNNPERENGADPGPSQRDKQQAQGRNVFSEKFAKKSIAEVAGIMSGLYEVIPQYGGNNMGWMNQQTVPQIPGASKLTIPKPNDFAAQMMWAREARDISLVRGPLARRRKFVVSGFQHRHPDERVRKLFDRIARDVKLKQTLKDLAWDMSTIGWAVVMPDTIHLIPRKIHILHDGVVNKRAFGFDNLFLMLDPNTVAAIRENPKNFPKYMVQAVKDPNNHENMVPLEDCYFLSTARSASQAFPRSPMYPLFEPLKVIENLTETQSAISSAIKKLILHVTVHGGKDAQGNERPANPKQLTTAAMQVRDGAQVSTIVTPATTELKFISPDKEIFEAAKEPYEKAMARIDKNINIPMILVDGQVDGVSFSTAVYIIKGFLQDVIDERETLLDDFVYPWYRKKAEELYNSDKKKYAFLRDEENDDWNIPKVIFNETELRNLQELLAVLKFKWQMGTYSPQTVMGELQDDFDTEKQLKEDFNDDTDWVGLPWEPGMGMGLGAEFVNVPPGHEDALPDPRMAQLDLQKDNFDKTHQQQKKMDNHQMKMDNFDRQQDVVNLKNQNNTLKQHNTFLQSQVGPKAAPGRDGKKAPGRAGKKAGSPAPGRKPAAPPSAKAPTKAKKPAGRPRTGEKKPSPNSADKNPRAGTGSPKSV